jgi:hypothetical protein
MMHSEADEAQKINEKEKEFYFFVPVPTGHPL